MARHQIVEIDVTFSDTWSEIKTPEILEIFTKKSVKNIKITNVTKRKEDK